jgi:hypothetical protein
MALTTYEREKEMVAEALAALPPVFRLRAFPELRVRAAHPSYSFVLDGAVQVVVECQPIADPSAPWQQLGRTDLSTLQWEIVETL